MSLGIDLGLKIVAVVLLGAAAYFYWTEDSDWTFACVVLAACSFFLSMRFSIKRSAALREAEKNEKDTAPPSD